MQMSRVFPQILCFHRSTADTLSMWFSTEAVYQKTESRVLEVFWQIIRFEGNAQGS
jgi:hypothetical protein